MGDHQNKSRKMNKLEKYILLKYGDENYRLWRQGNLLINDMELNKKGYSMIFTVNIKNINRKRNRKRRINKLINPL